MDLHHLGVGGCLISSDDRNVRLIERGIERPLVSQGHSEREAESESRELVLAHDLKATRVPPLRARVTRACADRSCGVVTRQRAMAQSSILDVAAIAGLRFPQWSREVPWWQSAMWREPRTGQDVSRPSAASRGNRHVGMLEDPVLQPCDRHRRNASYPPRVLEAWSHVSNRYVHLQPVSVLASHIEVGAPSPTVGKGAGQALNAPM